MSMTRNLSGNNTIPTSLLSQIFAEFLNDSERDILAAAKTCRAWRDAAFQQYVWEYVANKKYGEKVAKSTIKLYENDWVDMLRDDNKKGALPTIEFGGKPLQCFYKHNTPNFFYCCLIISVKWHRPSREVRVYIDARGQHDLSHPSTSSFCSPRSTFLTKGIWKPDSNNTDRRGHYKGYISFHEEIFQEGGTYIFCYANPSFGYHDYPDVPLIQRPTHGDLTNVFVSEGTKKKKYTTDVSPFVDDSVTVETHRWLPIIPL